MSNLPVIDEDQITEEVERIPPFPRLPGALGDLVDGITEDIAYDHKALAAITYVGLALSGRVKLSSDPWLQTRFYSCSVHKAAGGKSASDVEVRKALEESVLKNCAVELSMDSGPALVQALQERNRLILAPDELADQFEKARAGATGRNSLFGEFLRLYEGNTTANRTKQRKGDGGKVEITNAHFAILGSATVDRIADMFIGTHAVASGLTSRFVLSYSEQTMPRLKTPNDDMKVEQAVRHIADVVNPGSFMNDGEIPDGAPIIISLSTDAQDEIVGWRPFEDDGEEKMKRIVDHAKRFAMLIAAVNKATTIDRETMKLALQFADYQIALRELLLPKDASTDVQQFENRIIKFLNKCENRRGRSFDVIRNRVKPEDCRGGFVAFNRAWTALVTARAVLTTGVNQRGASVWILA